MQAAKKEQLVSLLRELASAGIAIVVVEHDLRLLRTVADVVEVMDAGRVIATGEPAQVLADPAVARAYLGTTPRVADS
jgi:ABC-type branched-subunit amino acid transport system ATPase component